MRAAEVSTSIAGWVENRPRSGLLRLDFGELWAYRELAAFLALRDIKVRYKQRCSGSAGRCSSRSLVSWSSRSCSSAWRT